MLSSPVSLDLGFRLGILVCFIFGFVCSIPSVWRRFFPTKKDGTPLGGAYLKAGEYGETEFNTSWSVFKEPLNAWSSLIYSVYGVAICVVGFFDYLHSLGGGQSENRMMKESGFSIMIGSFCLYLGASSFLFHASHTEVWRKADAGMTNGVMIPMVIFAVWDRCRIPGMDSYVMLSFCSFLLYSLTTGYLPYGSSDILLPSLIILVWALELLPRYEGVIHEDQYLYFLRCLFAVAGGALLRAIDVKRKAAKVRVLLISIYSCLLVIFGLLVAWTDDVTVGGIIGFCTVLVNPAFGHIFWHFASAYAIYIWWYMLRARPGNPSTPYGLDNVVFYVILFAAIKNAFRRILMTISVKWIPYEYRDRLRLTTEHIVFAIWGYNNIVVVPAPMHSWLLNPILCWFVPTFPYDSFMVYYIARVASTVEDVLFLWITGHTYSKWPAAVSTSSSGSGGSSGIGSISTTAQQEYNKPAGGGTEDEETASILTHDNIKMKNSNGNGVGDEKGATHSNTNEKRSVENGKDNDDVGDDDDDNNKKGKGKYHSSAPELSISSKEERAEAERLRSLHHNIASLLAVVSLFTGYAKIGSLVALCHDMGDIGLDIFKFFSLKRWRILQIISLLVAIGAWFYWRVWLYTWTVLYTVTFESKSMLDHNHCTPGHCKWLDVPERAPFLVSLLVFLVFNVVWMKRMILVGFRILFPTASASSITLDTSSHHSVHATTV